MSKRSLLPKVLLLVGSSVLSLVLAEGALRVTGAYDIPSIRFEHVRLSDNPVMAYELDPAHKGINRWGFRGPDFQRQPGAGVYRVLALGDSLAYGLFLDEARSFPRHLERVLQKRRQPGARRVEVLNMGVPGYSIIQQAEQLAVKGLALDPQLVVLMVCLNDWEPESTEFRQLLATQGQAGRAHLSRYYDPDRSALAARLQRVHLYRAVSHVWQQVVGGARPEFTKTEKLYGGNTAVQDTSVHQYHARMGFYVGHYHRVLHMLRERGIPLVVIVVPYGPSKPAELYRERFGEVQELSREQPGLRVIGFADEVRKHLAGPRKGQRLFQEDDVHLTDFGSRLAAEAVAEKVLELVKEPR